MFGIEFDSLPRDTKSSTEQTNNWWALIGFYILVSGSDASHRTHALLRMQPAHPVSEDRDSVANAHIADWWQGTILGDQDLVAEDLLPLGGSAPNCLLVAEDYIMGKEASGQQWQHR